MSDKIQVGLFVDPVVVEHLDTLAGEWGVKRSDAVKRMIETEHKKLTRRRLVGTVPVPPVCTLPPEDVEPVVYAEKGEQ